MAKICLINTRDQPFLAVEYHGIVCRRRDRCTCATSQRLNAKNKAVIVHHPASFHIEGKSMSKPLDSEVQWLQPVRDALKSRWLRLASAEEIKAAEPKPKAKAAPMSKVAKAPVKATKASK